MKDTARRCCALLPEGTAILDDRRNRMVRGEWGDGSSTFCIMNAFVPNARHIEDCADAGWPVWLANSCQWMYDYDTGSDDELESAVNFATRIADALSVPVDDTRAKNLFARTLIDSVARHDRTNALKLAADMVDARLDGKPARPIRDSMAIADATNGTLTIKSAAGPQRDAIRCALAVAELRIVDAMLHAANAARHDADETTHTKFIPDRIPQSFRTNLVSALKQSAL